MALAVYDRVQETTTTTGTGAVILAGAVVGYQTFAVVGNGNTTYYCITSNNAWEVGIGTYSTTGPSLARTTVLANSSGNTSPISLTGTSTVFCTYPAEKNVSADSIYAPSTFQGTFADGIVVDYTTGTGRISVGSADGITLYNGGVANTALLTVTSGGNVTAIGNLTGQQVIAANGIVVNNNTVNASYSIPSGYSATSVGPVTIATGQTVTVPSGSRWVIL